MCLFIADGFDYESLADHGETFAKCVWHGAEGLKNRWTYQSEFLL